MSLRKLQQYKFLTRFASFPKKTMATESATSKLVTQLSEAKRFMVDCLKAVGATESNAETVADNLLEADYRGHYSHGMNRLGMSNEYHRHHHYHR
ncbi:unnamed protein product [Acanthoscelides obtectus]|nr:unnamed protein product [Acanthoscelides obtectus]CAK1637815.1 hypothetical protein AOBTE_LOCUS10213 [Acanthoscelides obtectus]